MLHLGGIEESLPRAAPWKNKGQKKVEGLGRGVQTSCRELSSENGNFSSFFSFLFFSFLFFSLLCSIFLLALLSRTVVSLQSLVRWSVTFATATQPPQTPVDPEWHEIKLVSFGMGISFASAMRVPANAPATRPNYDRGPVPDRFPSSHRPAVSRRDKERDLPRIS